jgi:MFS family permease
MASRAGEAPEPHSEFGEEEIEGGLWGIAWFNRDLEWLFILRVLRSIAQGYLGIIVPLYMAVLGYGAIKLGILFSVSAIVAGVLSTLTGLLADRYGRKLFLIAISLMMAVAGVLFGLADSFTVLVAAGALGSIGRGGGAAAGGAWGPFYPAAQALVAERTSDVNRTHVFGALSFVGVMAGAIGSLMAALPHLLNRVAGVPMLEGYRVLFLMTGPFGVAMALAVIPVHETHGFTSAASGADQRERAADPPAPDASGRILGISRESWQLISRFMITNATNGLAIGMLGPFVVYWFYRRFGAGPEKLAELFFILNLATAVPYLMASRIAHAMGSVRAVVVTRAIACVLLVGMTLMPTFFTAALLYLIRMIFNVLSIPVRQSYLMGVIDPAERASAAGLANVPSQVTSAAGPYLAGVFMQHIALALPLEFAAAMQALNAYLYWLFFRNVYPPEELEFERNTVRGPEPPS